MIAGATLYGAPIPTNIPSDAHFGILAARAVITPIKYVLGY